MSHNHEDRVAQRDPCMCCAYGCPLLGVMSTSTSGGNEWWCSLHFGKDAGQMQRLTVEMNRREWLSHTITDLRKNYDAESWHLAYRTANHEFAMHQRTDLQHKRNEESVWRWIARLESELGKLCQDERPQQRQAPLVSTLLPDAGPQRVQLSVPEPA